MADKPTRLLSLGLEATGWGLLRAPLEMRLLLAACQPLLNLSRPHGRCACTEMPSVLLHVQTWVAVLSFLRGLAWGPRLLHLCFLGPGAPGGSRHRTRAGGPPAGFRASQCQA